MSAPSSGTADRMVPDIQLLRAVAVLGVIVFHLWPQRLPGGFVGVDAFFVISGYLISAHILREVRDSGKIGIGRFWARRIRRLFPIAMLVLAVTLVAVLIWVPRSQWQEFATEIGASAVYVENWVLAANAVDYFGVDNLASPVQHYWSLSVEEQFYIAWPLLIAAVLLITRRQTPAVRVAAIAGTMGVVLIASLSYSVLVTASSPAFAYFATPSHGWEFAAGGVLAVAMPRLSAWWSPHERTRGVVSWVGLTMLLASYLVFSGTSPFPGWIAGLPVAGVLAVIAAGTVDRPWTLSRVSRLRPIRFIGDTSYSAYLWHWPPIVIVPLIIGFPLDAAQKLLILAGTVALAGVSKVLVEDRMRYAPRLVSSAPATFAMGAVLSVVVVGGAVIPYQIVARAITNGQAAVASGLTGSDACFGARAALSGEACDDSHTVDPRLGPEFARADTDTWNGLVESGALAVDQFCDSAEVRVCTIGRPDAPVTIALVGDSHAAQYRTALIDIVQRHGWRLVTYIKGACSLVQTGFVSHSDLEMRDDCQQWKSAAIQAIDDRDDLDLVVETNASEFYAPSETAANLALIESKFKDTFEQWTKRGGPPVLVIADTPRTIGDVPDCVAEHPGEDDPCTTPLRDATGADPMLAAARSSDGVLVYDPTRIFCDADLCHTVIGGVIAFRDKHHLTTTFVRTLTSDIEASVLGALR